MSEKQSIKIVHQDFTGQVFGRLTVMERAAEGQKAAWVCKCSCGNTCTVLIYKLLSKDTQSCGCLQRQRSSECHITHGQAKIGKHTKTYKIWRGVLKRCNPKNAKRYPRYVGVYLDSAWLDFEVFFRDMGPCPKGLTIDRIKAELGYRPGNCRWATLRVQAENRKTTHWIEYQGRVQCRAAWERELGFQQGTIRRRLLLGWSELEAISTPIIAACDRSKGHKSKC